MKKKLLFIIPSLDAGGGEKSLVNLLNTIDYSKYEVDLFLFKDGGIFKEFVPKQVNILKLQDKYKDFTLPLIKSVNKIMKKKDFSVLINRFLFAISNKLIKDKKNSDQYTWKYMNNSIDYLDEIYDVAIGFLEKSSIYLCVDKVKAKKKIGFIHTDYVKSGMNKKIDIGYFEKLDNIVTVSDECLITLKNKFPKLKSKMMIFNNIVSPRMINKMSNLGKGNIYTKECNQRIILSIGRLVNIKGFDLAVKACKILVENNYDIKWYVIGDGEERENLVQMIKSYNLEDRFILLGLKSNPYPYIKQADIYAQTSRYEGKSIALDEAKILEKPIIVTDYSTAKDQIEHKVNGLIVDMNPEAISKGIEYLINDVELKNKLCTNLRNLDLSTENEIEKLYKIIDDNL